MKALFAFVLAILMAGSAAAAELRVYTARKIITMEPALPEATAVAVADGRIVAVGTLPSLQPWLAGNEVSVDRSLEDKVLLPGFIDPHVHPSLPAVLTQFPFLAPDDWVLPTGTFPGATTPQAYQDRLRELVAAHDDPTVPFIAWGYHPLWHGEVYRPQLNAWFPDTPVMLWHRSFHELIGNDAAFAMLGITEADTAAIPESDWAKGHFWENGLKAIVPRLPFLFEPARFGAGMGNFLELAHLLQSRGKVHSWITARPAALRWSVYYLLLLAIAFFGVFNHSEFIYFQF